MTPRRTLLLLAAIAATHSASAFVPSPQSINRATHQQHDHHHHHHHRHTRHQPSILTPTIHPTSPATTTTSSSSSTSLQSFFGLGPAELLIIAIAGLVVVGPSKLLQFSKEAGEVAGKTGSGLSDAADKEATGWQASLKAIPEEFQKGVEEGEIDARSRKAKEMDKVEKD